VPGIGTAAEHHEGSFICPDYELRITERCLVNDLGGSAGTTFVEAGRHPIVDAFRSKRAVDPRGGDTVGPAAGVRTLYTLRGAARSRGATLFDAVTGVVWLCAYGFHTSGEPDDAYQLFRALIDSKAILPIGLDYSRWARERSRRFTDLVDGHADALIAESRGLSGDVVAGRLGRELSTRLRVQPDQDLLRLEVAFPSDQLLPEARLHRTLAALARDVRPARDLIDTASPLPNTGEVGFLMYRTP
jgi:hypothetical protein